MIRRFLTDEQRKKVPGLEWWVSACRDELKPKQYSVMYRPCADSDVWHIEGKHYRAKFFKELMAGKWLCLNKSVDFWLHARDSEILKTAGIE